MLNPSAGSLQDLIPVVTFLRWKMNLKNEIYPSRPADHVRDSPAAHLYQHAPRLIGIERRHDFGTLWQQGDGRLETGPAVLN